MKMNLKKKNTKIKSTHFYQVPPKLVHVHELRLHARMHALALVAREIVTDDGNQEHSGSCLPWPGHWVL